MSHGGEPVAEAAGTTARALPAGMAYADATASPVVHSARTAQTATSRK
jgi:hypothetical protein